MTLRVQSDCARFAYFENAMDLLETIRHLKEEKERVERATAVLEEFLGGSRVGPIPVPKRRGRKSMPPQERREVSERMKKYSESRRKRKPE